MQYFLYMYAEIGGRRTIALGPLNLDFKTQGIIVKRQRNPGRVWGVIL